MKRFLLLLLTATIALAQWAASFEPTRLTAKGKFAPDTKWYVLTLTGGQLVITNNGKAQQITLNTPLRLARIDDNALWCFVGSDAEGYTIYNKAAGTRKSLAAPADRSANTGGDAAIVVKEKGAAGYQYLWNFAPFTGNAAGFATPYLLHIHGDNAANVNNREGKFAFWTKGTDAGSALGILTREQAATARVNRGEQYLFTTVPGQKPYRIPAIAQAKNGNLIAFTDFRPSGSDIGFGEVDIKARISKNNGKTWGKEFFVVDGTGVPHTPSTGFGDAAVVADRETNEVLVVMVNGHTTYWDGNYPAGNPNPTATIRSFDGGKTWGQWESITEAIYSPFKASKHGAIKSLFFGSGRLVQSQRIKVGTHYRIYGAVAARDHGNRVFYSDDFGRTWHVLGGVDALPCPDGDEPKVEELPNGNVVLSSRSFTAANNRFYNIFTYSNFAEGQGTWAAPVNSGSVPNGVLAVKNNTNGEILIVPARRKADGANLCVALQSVPFGPGRTNVGIYYKGLAEADYLTPEAFAANWEGRKQVSTMGSAYSTMILQHDGRIGFYYEEATFGADYTEVYIPLTLEQITDGKYEVDTTFDPAAKEKARVARLVESYSKTAKAKAKKK